MTITWHVLVEENISASVGLDEPTGAGHVDAGRWSLSISEAVDGDREQARALAEELALTHTPEWMLRGDRPGDAPQRTAYLKEDGSWLVGLKHHRGLDVVHLRISAARRMHHQDETRASRRFL